MATRFLGPFVRQINPHDKYGRFNCSAYCFALLVTDVTCAGLAIAGSGVRAMSNEPIPNPASPGLNIPQLDHVAVELRVHYYDKTGEAWDVLVNYAKTRDVTVQVDYKSLGAYRAQADGDFGHMLTIVGVRTVKGLMQMKIYDPLATKYRWIPASVVRHAAQVFATDTQQVIGLRFAVSNPIPKVA